MSESENFTSRSARWSAAHRKGVVRGWLAFVLLAFAIGSVAGVVALKRGKAATASRSSLKTRRRSSSRASVRASRS